MRTFCGKNSKCSDSNHYHFMLYLFGCIYLEDVIMSLKPDQKMEIDEIKFFNELGWFATIAVVVASFAPYFSDIFV